jgi:hypothetical protein
MFYMLNPVRFSILLQARAGAIPKSMGATPASSYATIRASGLRPLALAAASDIKTNATAPSLILLAFAAVIVPFLAKAGLSEANLSGKNF